jgi:hypothetical protein
MQDAIQHLAKLADLIGKRNVIDAEIAAILSRPVHSGHFGEYVASVIFGIELNPSASAKSFDGRFRGGPLAGRSVNVKYGTTRDGNLNLGTSPNPGDHPDFYLVLTGPRATTGTSRGTTAPWTIHDVFLFESRQLLAALAARGIRPGTAASVRRELWDAATVFPEARNTQLPLAQEQRDALLLFNGAVLS